MKFHLCYVPYVCNSSNAMRFVKNPSTGLCNSPTATYILLLISISIFCYVLYAYWLPHGLLLNIVRGHLRREKLAC